MALFLAAWNVWIACTAMEEWFVEGSDLMTSSSPPPVWCYRRAACFLMCTTSTVKSAMISWPRVVLFGDSITQFAFEANGWGATLANKLVRKCDVLNRGLSGYNTRWAKHILPKLIAKSSDSETTAAVTIFFGANDSSLKEENPQQHVPLDEYVDNLRTMIRYLQSLDITPDRLILIAPPPIYEPSWERQCFTKGYKLNRLNSIAGEYAKACVLVGQDCGTEVLDLWTLMQEGGQDYTVYLSDGLHLSDKGNEFLESKLWPILEQKLGALPFLLPYWMDVDNKNPEPSLFPNCTEKKEEKS